MYAVLILLLNVIFILLMFRIMFFEIGYNRVKKTDNYMYYLTLEQPFNYNRTGYMIFILFLCYLLTSEEEMFSTNWILYLLFFIAFGIVADIAVQYLVLQYSKLRCKKQIIETKEMKEEVLKLKEYEPTQEDYYESEKAYNETDLLKNYVDAHNHLAFLTVDKGEFAKNYSPYPTVTYDVEPYGDLEALKENLSGTPVRPTTLTQAKQMPFKDDKIDVIMDQFCNYDKNEIQRVLKPGGYVLINQNGTSNFDEIVKMYIPYKIKGEWTADSCAKSLSSIGFEIISTLEDHGYINFYSIEGVYSFFKKHSPDFCDVDKYLNFYMAVLNKTKKNEPYRLSTYKFLVIARN